MSKIRKALIITGGSVDLEFLRSYYEQNTDLFVVGVDGGCKSAMDSGLPIDLMYGDFDTLDTRTKEELFDSGLEHKVLVAEKDLTDTHGAIEEVISRNYKDITIFGGLGSRIDHTLANLMVSFKYIKECKITYLDSHNQINFYEGPCDIQGQNTGYKYISLIPITDTLVAQTKGLKYNLKNANLSPYDSLGISNEIQGAYHISITKGKLLITQSDDKPHKP